MQRSSDKKRRWPWLGAGIALAVAGCSQPSHVGNLELVSEGLSYQAQYRSDPDASRSADTASTRVNAEKCTLGTPSPDAALPRSVARDEERLSPGDLVEVNVAEDETFTGSYEVSQDGMLKLPYLRPVPAVGRSVSNVEESLVRALMASEFYRERPRVSVRLADVASARVHVAGAVFEPMAVAVGGATGDAIDKARQSAIGAAAGGRRLSGALQAAGGVRPDADLSRIVIRRGSKTMSVDLRSAIKGYAFSDPLLLEGDQIEVSSRGCFQEELMVPSSVTAPGVKVFMSNLSQPANANALSAIGKEARELRYGTRFIQALVGMNCVGGAKWTNAHRTAVLFSRNPITGKSIVIERSIEDLLRRADRDEYDPYLMPGDALACYDSTATNVIELARGFGTVSTSAALLLK
ncbi:protein involved in polysaccharide export with SLBB domain [Rhodobium orientis]|uniref:Polysaccharide biosynthesis protein n=1 Tax=Rhodobium orientis TaxID=34017 RepID=A0A327JNG4_9HYPH|nr:polysaccharide biosynthesis/export family protein [Rhodobium orientis]MBB4303164.1 protein involved in polysaccharide export with SLBB domain [Rhodobium orientis]MBK5951735.1 polysaccharide biosynthesis protein [Rhodobium orientis]RAI26913.1 polysaccharide biosynthesis protein [Rhodobium orientis]